MIVLPDEPTANLDSAIGRQVARRLEEIADWVLWLEDGAFQELATMATDRVCCMTVTSTTDPPPAGLCWRIYESYELVIC
jgi:hypothetical protein